MKLTGQKSQVKGSRRGFTMVELMITLGIFLVMTSVVLARYRLFGINAEFANAVEGIVLSLREAQVYGAGSKTTGGAVLCNGSAFNCAYGVRFTQGTNSYIVFIDEDDDYLYDTGETIIANTSLGANASLVSVQYPAGCSGTTAYVTFKRPNIDARIADPSATLCESVLITVENTDGTKQSVINVTSTGQISVQ